MTLKVAETPIVIRGGRELNEHQFELHIGDLEEGYQGGRAIDVKGFGDNRAPWKLGEAETPGTHAAIDRASIVTFPDLTD